ncbi:suppressor APC domain-containing protein 2 [Terrapene carolina triunguis]|uniref:suppressor APC domain-containing protein 2 n=1 Tax=Terrapene triunguis TaxID=2587831 RepID=UPI000CEFB1CA|nr:suppressor APC domain-containing protein 2 [Terrapene carolina triunguis]
MAPERGARPLPCGTEGLPRAFLQSLRTLFDILDDRRRGYVHLREIESRWQGAEARELPPGVLEGLRQAAPASGYLTFERFVLGLRASLLSPANGGKAARPAPGGCDPAAPKGGPGRGQGEPRPLAEKGRCSSGLAGSASRSMEKIPSPPGAPAHRAEGESRGRSRGADGKPTGQSHCEGSCTGLADARRQERGRGEHRRHTITNGVDYGMLKQMKELEQEKDFLLQGLEMVERAREWYHQQIQTVQERQKHLGKNKTTNDFFPEGSQSHLGRLLPKLQEVNRCLGELLSTSGKPLNSSSSALTRPVPAAPVPPPALAGSQQAISMLKEQNRLLTKEVTEKSERITQLEQEKSALIKQLFEARARNNHETSQLDSTFI